MLWIAVGDYRGPRKLSIFLRYVAAHINQQERETAYRIYVTDCLRIISQSAAESAKMAGGEGKYITARFADFLHPKPEETRTGEEIIADLRRKLEVS